MVGAVIVAAGMSNRMNGVNKLLVRVGGMTVIERALRHFENCGNIDYIVVVTRKEMADYIKNLKLNKVIKIVEGGSSRQDSVREGINVCPEGTEIIAIHDGARPFIESGLIEKVTDDCKKFGAAMLGVKVKDTIKITENGFIEDTPDRDKIYIAQTPQVFEFNMYKEALRVAYENNLNFTDDCQLVENIGKKVYITEGSYRNIKITTAEDIDLAKHILGDIMIKVGHGYDVHKLTKDRKLILGGVEIPFEYGLLGHSDADVLVHAIMDAILGAIGEGDIGKHFPDNDNKFKGISSLKLLESVIGIMREKRFEIGNIDATVIAEKPKLSGFVTQMKQNIARICEIGEENINIKATTEEGLGFTGEGKGISAHAVVTVVGSESC